MDAETQAWADAGMMFIVGWDEAEDGQPFDACSTNAERDGWLAAKRQQDLAVDEAQYTPRPGIDF